MAKIKMIYCITYFVDGIPKKDEKDIYNKRIDKGYKIKKSFQKVYISNWSNLKNKVKELKELRIDFSVSRGHAIVPCDSILNNDKEFQKWCNKNFRNSFCVDGNPIDIIY